MNRFDQTLQDRGLDLTRSTPEILQLNVGKLCNLTCAHCHVNAGPKRKEIVTRETLDRILDWFERSPLTTLDLTGGAPEMIPDFRHVIERVAAMTPRRRIMDRCNLTILLEPGYEDMAEFLAKHEVEIVASMPCYSAKNVNAQRGEGVFDASITALQRLNALGYGIDPKLPLHLVYNPLGDFLPGDQAELEEDYHRELQEHFGITFNHLFTITNMPIARFASWLRHEGKYESYLDLLIAAFNPAAVDGLMCRNTINVGWRGEVYDCDFNQQLNLQLRAADEPLYVWNVDLAEFATLPILTGAHCFGCTAGAGSSCGGALTETVAQG
jgi:radical SAM/Cys-rich protein